MAQQTLEILRLEQRQPDLQGWRNLVDRMNSPENSISIAIVGKYIQLSDAYLSVVEALGHAAIAAGSEITLKWVNAEDITKHGAAQYLQDVSGMVVPGGFGIRGVDGKVAAIQYARENNLPFLGLCLGMQCSVIEWARNTARLERANSSAQSKEFLQSLSLGSLARQSGKKVFNDLSVFVQVFEFHWVEIIGSVGSRVDLDTSQSGNLAFSDGTRGGGQDFLH